MSYGPNHVAVEEFRRSLYRYPWFQNVGEPIGDELPAIAVDFHFVADHHSDSYKPWGELLSRAEERIERLVFDHHRLDEHALVLHDFKISHFLSSADFFVNLDTRYSDPETGYYRDTHMYPHELVTPPDRLVFGAASELMLLDIDPTLDFFQTLMPWLQVGRLTLGWSGEWPEGRIIVW